MALSGGIPSRSSRHIRIFMGHRYLIQALGNNGVDGCLETNNMWRLQRNLDIDRRVEVNQMSGDVQYGLMYLHPIHTKNDIDPLPFQYNTSGQKHLLDKLKWDFMGHLISNHSTSRSDDRVRHLGSTKRSPSFRA
jgi:hypothetical protein